MTASKADANDAAKPLDEAWWEDAKDADDWMPADDVPLLGAYEKTQPGFEIVFGAGPGDQSLADGHCRLCLWSIWEKKKDPAETDPQKQKINEMQRGLGNLDDQARFLRLQIACLQRCHYTFPANVDLVLDGIASGQPRLDAEMSCEPPWVGLRLILLRRRNTSADRNAPVVDRLQHRQGLDPLEDQRDRQIRAYATILTWWSAAGSLDCLKAELPAHADLAETIYRRLGEPTKLKWLYVQKLCANLNRWGMPALAWERWVEMGAELGNAYDAAIQQALGGQEDRISRLIDRNNDNGSCHHAFFRHVDHMIAHIGAGRPVTLPGAGEEGKRIRDTVTNYVHALGSWVAGRTLKETIEIWPACEDVATRAYDMLGEPTPVKRWLAACLWKMLQDNQAHHGRGALDEQPGLFALPPDVMPELPKPDATDPAAPAGWCIAEGRWSVDADDGITGESGESAYLYRIEEHPDDFRITAKMRAIHGIEITVWICGSPEKTEMDGYTLAVSTEKAKLQRQGEDVATDEKVTIQPDRDHVLAFERRGATLRGLLDGAAKPFIEWTDPDPLRGEGHRTLGFYVWDGTVAISDIKVEELSQ